MTEDEQNFIAVRRMYQEDEPIEGNKVEILQEILRDVYLGNIALPRQCNPMKYPDWLDQKMKEYSK